MTERAALWTVLIIPATAFGGDVPATQTGSFSILSSFLQMFASLAVIIGVILLIKYLLSRVSLGGVGGASRLGHIRIIETRFLAPKKSLILIEVGGEYLLLSNAGETLTLIKQIDMLEEIEIIEEIAPGASPPMTPFARFRNRFGGSRSDSFFKKTGV